MTATMVSLLGYSTSAAWPVVLCVGLLTFVLYKWLSASRTNLPPGPRGLRAFWDTLFALKEGRLHKEAKIWSDKFGELVLCRSLLGDVCFLNSARLVKEMFLEKERELLTNDRPTMFSGWYIFYNFKDLATAGPSTTPDWAQRRRLFHHSVKLTGVERLEKAMHTELQRLSARVETEVGVEIDMDELLSTSLLCMMTVLMTGETLEPDGELVGAMTELNAAVNEVYSASTDATLATFPFLRFIPGTFYREVCHRVIEKRDAVLHELFTKVKASHTPGQPRGCVDVLLDEQLKGENHWLSDDHIRGIIIDILAFGHSAILQTLKSIFLYLAHHPEVTQKLQKEIDEVLGQQAVQMKDKSKLPYTEAVVMETLRCSSIVPLNDPHQAQDDVSIDGFTVPKGATIFANQWTIYRDAKVWGDCDVFRPERFLDDVTGQLLPPTHPTRQGMVPFGVGRRSCPGENFGRIHMFVYVITLLQKFDILPPVKNKLPPADPALFGNGIVLEPAPYHLIFRSRT